MAKPKQIKSGIIYSGPSSIDGKPIVAIAIAKSTNSKTGNMVQTYIIRSDIDPITANRIGADYSICGNCKHRGIPDSNKSKGLALNRTCYVNIGQGVMQVYKSYLKGNYRQLTIDEIESIGANRMVRIGTYGDGMAIPQSIIDRLIKSAIGHTAYTHQLDTIGADNKYMISADNESDAIKAHQLGYRTFRVIPIADSNKPLLKNEIYCPSNRGVHCVDCKLCNGVSNAKSIAIVAHGPTANKYK